MITKRAKYALKALLHLAEYQGGAPVHTADIASQECIPRRFLEQILLDLRKRGMVRSHKGRHGGFTLARPPQEIPLVEVLRLVDGPQAPLPCLSRTAYARCQDCPEEGVCGVRLLFVDVYDAMLRHAESRTLADGLGPKRSQRKK